MQRILSIFVASALLAAPLPAMAAGPLSTPSPALSVLERIDILRGAVVLNAACCKICRKGKACGDSCIRASYSCRKGPGCACNG